MDKEAVQERKFPPVMRMIAVLVWLIGEAGVIDDGGPREEADAKIPPVCFGGAVVDDSAFEAEVDVGLQRYG